MIIFYEKSTGKIVGTIEGRIHSKSHLKMWIGDRKKIGRLIIQWKPVKWYTEEEAVLPNECLKACDKEGNLLARTADFEPDCEEYLKPIIIKNEKNPRHLRQNYKFDAKGKLREKTKKEKADDLKAKRDFEEQRKQIVKQKQKIVARIKNKDLPIEERFNDLIGLINLDRLF